MAADSEPLDYSGFVPTGEIPTDLTKNYTDALADQRIEQLFESMPNTVHASTISFRSDTAYGVGGRLVDFTLEPNNTDYTMADYIAEGSFTADSVSLQFKTFNGDVPQTLTVKKSPNDALFHAFTDDSFDILQITGDQIVELCLRASDNPPDLTPNPQAHTLVRPTFELTLAEFWRHLAVANDGLTTRSQFLEIPLGNSVDDTQSFFGRLLQEEIEKPFEVQQRLILEHVIMHEALDAEEVTRLELEYTWKKDKTQGTRVSKYVVSGIDPTTMHLRIKRRVGEGKEELLDLSDPKYLEQFQLLLDYILELSTK